MLLDYSFYQKNEYNFIEYNNLALPYSLLGIFNKNSNSLFTLPISLQLMCFREASNNKEYSNPMKYLMLINMVISSIYFLFSTVFFTYQIIFSLLISHYVALLIEE